MSTSPSLTPHTHTHTHTERNRKPASRANINIKHSHIVISLCISLWFLIRFNKTNVIIANPIQWCNISSRDQASHTYACRAHASCTWAWRSARDLCQKWPEIPSSRFQAYSRIFYALVVPLRSVWQITKSIYCQENFLKTAVRNRRKIVVPYVSVIIAINIILGIVKRSPLFLHEIEWKNNGFLFTTPNIRSLYNENDLIIMRKWLNFN